MRTIIASRCLYCGLELPDTPDFCPHCGRPIEDAIRVKHEVQTSRITKASVRGCLYCGLTLSDTTKFCPDCGRSIERDLGHRSNWQSEADCVCKEG